MSYNKNNAGGGGGGGGPHRDRESSSGPTGRLKRGGTVGGEDNASALGDGPRRRSIGASHRSSVTDTAYEPMEPTFEEEWHYHLPDSWSCQENNAAGIVGDEYGLRLISPGSPRKSSTSRQPVQRVALVVANKPIPMAELIQQADKRKPPRPHMNPRQPSYHPKCNDGGSIFPTFTKPSRHERVDSDPEHVPDLSSLVGMLGDTKIYDGIVPKAQQGAPSPAGLQRKAAAPPSDPAYVYYFEVKIVAGVSWIGLVPAESVVTPEQAQMIGGSSSAATKPNPFPILIDQIPGKSPGSIGLGCNGRLFVSGSTVCRDGTHLHTYGAGARSAEPWTDPFEDHAGTVTIGCGWEIGGQRRVFFTQNGSVLHPDRPITGFDARGDTMFPAVGMQTEGTDIVANFGLDASAPLSWKGDQMFHSITDRVAGDGSTAQSNSLSAAGINKDSGLSGLSANSLSEVPYAIKPTGEFNNTSSRSIRNSSEGTRLRGKADPFQDFQEDAAASSQQSADDSNVADGNREINVDRKKQEEVELEAAIKKSMEETSFRRLSETLPLLMQDEIEDVKGIARELRGISQEPNADPKVLRSLLEMNKSKQLQIMSNLEQEADSVDFDSLLELNNILLISIEAAESALTARKPDSFSPRPTRSEESSENGDTGLGRKVPHEKRRRQRKGAIKISSPEVDSLVESRDIFSLICLLRGHHENRLAAAHALMRFAKDEAKDETSTDVRKEILASGGMHSLLTLFRSSKDSSKDGAEVKIFTALAVAYLLPCFTDHAIGNVGLKVIECLRYLVDSSKQGDSKNISSVEMLDCAALALTHLWLNSLQAILSEKDDPGKPSKPRIRRRGSAGRPLVVRNVGPSGRRLDQRQDTLEIQEFLETTVSLIVTVAEEIQPQSHTEHDGEESHAQPRYSVLLPAVESVCSVEVARPVAVRQGLLKVLVNWLSSGDVDLVMPAANALRDLTSLNDAYMAGWIHSQLVNEGAIPAIVKLSGADQADVRLAVAEILSSLSVAPHTRAAIIDNSGLDYLLQLLVNSNVTDSTWDEFQGRTALAVGNALLQLAAGAMTSTRRRRKSSATEYSDISTERMDVINYIVQGGAIEPLVYMAKSEERGKLRLMSVDLMCIISEEARPGFGIRQKLCHAGAPGAFGMVLRQDAPELYRAARRSKTRLIDEIGAKLGDTLGELYSALLALANLLEPVSAKGTSGRMAKARVSRESLSIPANYSDTDQMDWQDTLITALMQTAESGGLESLLLLTSLPIASNARQSISDVTVPVDVNELRIESCRSLASLCPLLLSKSASESGLTRWAGDVLLALTNVLKCKIDGDDHAEAQIIHELQLDALRGLCSLAQYEPLKIRIIDGSLSLLLQLKNTRGDVSEFAQLAKEANQVCLALGFRDDEIDLQLIGNDPKLSADWFCLERTMLLQAMARDEIKKCLCNIWDDAIRQVEFTSQGDALAFTNSIAGMEIIEEVTEQFLPSSSSGYPEGEGGLGNNNADNAKESLSRLKRVLFTNLGDDDSSAELRSKMLFQYANIYGTNAATENESKVSFESSSQSSSLLFDDTDFSSFSSPLSKESRVEGVARRNSSLAAELRRTTKGSADPNDTQEAGLLGISPCTMIGNMTERDWILAHRQGIDSAAGCSSVTKFLLPDRVQMLLNIYFPSKLIQSEVLPLHDFCPDASFDFRALAMPERRYFSFRREGQVLSRVCEKHAADLDSEEVYWTLGFSNSTFAGEFAETLVQALYRCPIIQAMTFSKHKEDTVEGISTEEDDEGSTLLANLAGSLPPWVTYLTFDNVLSKLALTSLVTILETMGQLSAESQQVSSGRNELSTQAATDNYRSSQIGNAQGAAFRGLAIRNSPQLRSEAFMAFFRLLGFQNTREGSRLRRPPLLSLRVLDLSGNSLGDSSVASVLSIIHDENSQCSLERLDVSGNAIGEGVHLTQVLKSYIQRHRQMQFPGVGGGSNAWRSPLRWLSLASNNLYDGQLALELVAMLKNNALGLKSLDLSNNGLTCNGDFLPVLSFSLQSNTELLELSLSKNCFQCNFANNLIKEIQNTEGSPLQLAFLHLDQNNPPLDDEQINCINTILNSAKMVRVKHHLEELQRPKPTENEPENDAQKDHKSWPTLDPGTLGQGLSANTQSVEPSQIQGSPYRREHLLGRDRTGGRIDDAIRPRPQPVRMQSEPVVTSQMRTDVRPGAEQRKVIQPKRRPLTRNNKITVLFSAPLVYKDKYDRYRPIDSLDFELERELLWQCFKEASMDIELSFDNATTDRLQATMTKGCGCLHFSGHGHPSHLTFEDGKGGMHWLAVDTLKDLISNDVHGGEAPFQFVFVSACHSLLAGTTFVNAGVPHVVCCQQESQLMDSAALAFTRAFYLALAIGRTVKDSFEIGRQAVAVSPSVPEPDIEMKKFVLLPEDGNHDFPVFDAEAVTEWPKKPESGQNATVGVNRRSILRKNVLGSSRHFDMLGGQVITEQHLPTPPQGFLGREVELYLLLNAVLEKRLVNLVGITGIGRSSLAAALCHYINDRKSTMIAVESIFYVRARQASRDYPLGSVLFPLQKQLVASGKATRLPEDSDVDVIISNILKTLRGEKALVVFDRVEMLEGTEEAQEFLLFLNTLFRQTRHVRVLMTGCKPLGLSSLGGVGEHVKELGPLNLKNTVKLFGILCPHVHTAGERAALLRALVHEGEEDLCVSDGVMSERSRDIMNMLGEGIPSRVFDVAYQMTKEGYIDLATNRGLRH